MNHEEKPFRCPYCDLLFGWTDGRQLRTRGLIFNDRMRMRCAGCGESFEWGPEGNAARPAQAHARSRTPSAKH